MPPARAASPLPAEEKQEQRDRNNRPAERIPGQRTHARNTPDAKAAPAAGSGAAAVRAPLLRSAEHTNVSPRKITKQQDGGQALIR